MTSHSLGHYDIIIAGAGPAGCTAALALRGSGLRVAVLEKARFPRDKVCGDAIPARCITTLQKIDPALAASFKNFPRKCTTRETDVLYKGRTLTFGWVVETYVCARLQFDAWIFKQMAETSGADILQETALADVLVSEEGVEVTTKGGDCLTASLLIGADGAHSPTARKLAGRTLDRRHHIGSVRAYFRGVADVREHCNEVFMNKDFQPGYLWVFPVGDDVVNVGYGMVSEEIVRRKADLKKLFHGFLEATPALREKFAGATQVSALEGHGLPLGSRRAAASGERYMLVGDAASLIDPISGDGIGNAMFSAKLAAEHAITLFQTGDFSAGATKRYEDRLYKALWPEFRLRYRAQRVLHKFPALIDLAFWAGRNPALKKLLQKGL